MALIMKVIVLALVSKFISEFFTTGNIFAVYADQSTTTKKHLTGGLPEATLPGESGNEVDITTETLMVPNEPLVKVKTTVVPPFEPNPLFAKELNPDGSKSDVKVESIKKEEVITIPGYESPVGSKKKSVVTITNDIPVPYSKSGDQKKKSVTFSDEVDFIEPAMKGKFTTFGYTPEKGYTEDADAAKIYRGGVSSHPDDHSDYDDSDIEYMGTYPVHTPASYDGMSYVNPYDVPKSSETKLDKLSKGAKNTFSKAGKSLEKVADKTKNSTMTLVKDLKGKAKGSKVLMEKQFTAKTSNPTGQSTEYHIETSQFNGKFGKSPNGVSTKASQILKYVGDKTKEGVSSFANGVKVKTAVASKYSNGKFNVVKEKIRVCGHKNSKTPCKLRKNEKAVDPRTKGSMTMYFRDKYGRLLSEHEIKHL
ncbi:uncharacterized protein TA21195 [Theileria annulata]|uniref:Uncharacterized protein n=1 Tax=Theileria annulata TaxID=5874 RepID=Q4UGR8_THEAN|nr:uncharacterized protein TA21195 [Theileria annulata]CAI73721.1 hypothetical protein TA21195 [Theileria annulata]|eukprot:XP_954398.1 hypothetical protein TA21195 [Theileria annulata]